ncbi:MAG: hypothetical protein MUC95_03820 [Spirochaetes bacterium]|nr:hypothetical protein [Spirochaetota bacterium]
MDHIHQILRNIPLFYHFTDKEIADLADIGSLEKFKKGRRIELRNLNSFVLIIKGIFEFESSIKKDILYLMPGAFFGEKPFVSKILKGSVRSMTDSEIMIFNTGDIYRFFLSTYKGLKGYIKNIKKLGFEMSEPARQHFGNGCRVITVFNLVSGSGKTVFSSFLGLSLSERGKTIIVDASPEGNSIYKIFEKEIPVPLSQKSGAGKAPDQIIEESITRIDENLSLLNLSSGSRVAINPEIISPVLFYLSRSYKYVILDLSNPGADLVTGAISFSDKIFCPLKSPDEKNLHYNLFDSLLRDGQRIYYVLNKFFAKGVGTFEGGYLFDDLEIRRDESLVSGICNYVKEEIGTDIIDVITAKTTGLVLDTCFFESALYLPLFLALSKSRLNINIIYSSAWSYAAAALYVHADFYSDFAKELGRCFSEDRISSLLDITFPDRHLYKNGRIYKFFRELTGESRVETYKTVPAAMLTDAESGQKRIFTTGFFYDLITASFSLNPLFEPLVIGGRQYYNNFFIDAAKPQDLLRTDTDEIIFAEVRNSRKLEFNREGILSFYMDYTGLLQSRRPFKDLSYAADKKINIDFDIEGYDLEEISNLAEEISKKISV